MNIFYNPQIIRLSTRAFYLLLAVNVLLFFVLLYLCYLTWTGQWLNDPVLIKVRYV